MDDVLRAFKRAEEHSFPQKWMLNEAYDLLFRRVDLHDFGETLFGQNMAVRQQVRWISATKWIWHVACAQSERCDRCLLRRGRRPCARQAAAKARVMPASDACIAAIRRP